MWIFYVGKRGITLLTPNELESKLTNPKTETITAMAITLQIIDDRPCSIFSVVSALINLIIEYKKNIKAPAKSTGCTPIIRVQVPNFKTFITSADFKARDVSPLEQYAAKAGMGKKETRTAI